MKEKNKKFILFGIIIIALIARIHGAATQEFIGDEGVYAFRGFGYIDHLDTSSQTQPIDWFKDSALPWWTHLSFHDAPPLGFIIWHIFFKIFGAFSLVARLPGILLGSITPIIFYLILRKTKSENESDEDNKKKSIITAFFAAISAPAIWISQSVLLESFQIFFIVTSIYTFFLFLKNQRKWWLFGLMTGASLLIKYTSIFLLPVYLIFILLYKKEIFKNKNLYLSLVAIILLLSPVIIYNVYLYKSVGHFDLQISYVLHEKTPEWQGLIGKSQYPISEIFKNGLNLFGPEIIILFIGAFFVFKKNILSKKISQRNSFWIIYTIFSIALLLLIGSAPRFLTILIPPAIILWGYAISAVVKNFQEKKQISKIAIIIFLAPLVSAEIFWSITLNKNKDIGLIKLDNYLREEIQSGSLAIPSLENRHLDKIAKSSSQRNNGTDPVIIIYDDAIAAPTRLWVFERRLLYDGIPIFFIDGFKKAAEENINQFNGFEAYYIESTEYTERNPFKKYSKTGKDFASTLSEQGISPLKIIYGENNNEMFRVYKFSIES